MVREHLVLVCPACQRRPGWSAQFQSCARCGSLHLIRRLDQVECLDCRLVRDAAEGATPEGATPEGATPEGATTEGATTEGATTEGATTEGTAPEGSAPDGSAPAAGPAGDAALAAEVASALRRVLRRP